VTGPVQVLVVGFDDPTFSGEVLAEFTRLREAGIVRLIDLLVVTRTEDGLLETLEAPESTAADLGGLAAEVLSQQERIQQPREPTWLTSTQLRSGLLPTPYRWVAPPRLRFSSTSGPSP
jgi:hypothetical protein